MSKDQLYQIAITALVSVIVYLFKDGRKKDEQVLKAKDKIIEIIQSNDPVGTLEQTLAVFERMGTGWKGKERRAKKGTQDTGNVD